MPEEKYAALKCNEISVSSKWAAWARSAHDSECVFVCVWSDCEGYLKTLMVREHQSVCACTRDEKGIYIKMHSFIDLRSRLHDLVIAQRTLEQACVNLCKRYIINNGRCCYSLKFISFVLPKILRYASAYFLVIMQLWNIIHEGTPYFRTANVSVYKLMAHDPSFTVKYTTGIWFPHLALRASKK